MRTQATLWITALAGLAGERPDLVYAPPPGLAIGYELALAVDAECVELRVLADGQPLPPQEAPPGLNRRALSTQFEFGARFEDSGFEYLEAVSAPARFVRTLGGLTFGGIELKGLGVLSEGTRLRYVREGDGYSARVIRSAEDAGSEDPLLELLHPDLGAAFLLPKEPVEEGDSWTIELELDSAVWMLMPGLRFDGVDELAGLLGLGELELALLEELTVGLEQGLDAAKLRVEWTATREQDDGRWAELDLEGELTLGADVTRTLSAYADRVLETGQSADIEHAQLGLVVEWTGKLEFDLSAGHTHALALDADWRLEVDCEGEVDEDGELIPIEVLFAWEGTQEASLETDPH